MKKYLYGIDVGGTSIKMGLFSNKHELLKKWEISTNTKDNGEHILFDIVKSIKKHTPNLDEVIGYGIGIPGPVVDNYNPITVNLGWKDKNIKEELEDILQNENIYVANDANVAALGEATYGAGLGEQDVVMFTLGTGVGSGFVVHGKLLEGAQGSAGELGHLTIDPNSTLQCNCGKKGCLETVASATGFKRVYQLLKKDFTGDSTLKKLEHPSAKAIFDAAKKGDELALKVVDYCSFYLGYACHIASIATNPSVIVIGGGVSKAGKFLIDKIKAHFDVLVFAPTKGTRIVEATLGNDAGIYGAMQLVVNNG